MSLLKYVKYNTDVYFKKHLCDIKITFGIRRLTNASIALIKVESINQKTKLNIEFKAYDFNGKIALIIAPIALLIFSILIIIKEAYPALILFIPFSILFLVFQRFAGRKLLMSFKKELVNLFVQL